MKRNNCKIIFVLFFVVVYHLFPRKMFSQNPTYKQYTVKDGLAGSMVYDVLQDKDGFIWFATNNGVSRFDGRVFKNFSKDDGLPDNDVIKLYLDKHNNVWFISLLGIPSYYSDGKIKVLENCSGVKSVGEDALNDSIYLYIHFIDMNGEFLGNYSSKNANGNWVFKRTEYSLRNNLSRNKIGSQIKLSIENRCNVYCLFPDKATISVGIKYANCEKKYQIRSVFDSTSIVRINNYDANLFSRSFISSGVFAFTNYEHIFAIDTLGAKPIVALKELGIDFKNPGDLPCMFYENDTLLWVCTKKRGLLKVSISKKGTKVVKSYFPGSYCTMYPIFRTGSCMK